MKLNVNRENGLITVITQNEDGTLNYNPLVPGQFKKVRALLSDDLYTQVEEIWSDDVIKDWRDSLKEAQNDGEL